MHILFIILLVFKIAKAENNIQSKYIDLLPEKEKENFLDNIARRILEEVQTKDISLKASGELSDDQLNQHSEFVNQILKEESENLRKRANDTADEKKGNMAQDKKEDINNEDRYVDLTLRTDTNRTKRENNRRVLNGHSTDAESNTDRVIENGEESDVDIQVKNFRRSKENVEVVNINEHSDTKTQPVNETQNNESTKQSEDNPERSETNSQDNLKDDNVSKAGKNISTEEIHAPLNSHRDSKEHKTENANMKTSVEGTTSASVSDLKEKDNKKILKNVDTIENADIINSSEAPQNISSRVARSYNDNLESDNQEHKNLANNNDTDSKVINIDITLATENGKKLERELISVTENVGTINSNEASTDTNKIIDKTETVVEILTTTLMPVEHSKSINKNNDELYEAISRTKERTVQNVASNHNNKKTNIKLLPKNSNSLANDVLFVEKNEKDKNFNELDTQYEKNKITEYKVFEISPETSPFVKQKSQKTRAKPKAEIVPKEPKQATVNKFVHKNSFHDALTFYGLNTDANVENNSNADVEDEASDTSAIAAQEASLKTKAVRETQKEQAYYAPVYNYSHKNAFYNPYNYFGPNTEKEIGKDRNIVDYDVENYNVEKYDANDDINDNELNERLEREYYFPSVTPLRFKFGDNSKSPKLSKGEPYKLNLPIAAYNFKFKDINFNPKDFLDTDYYPGRKVRMRTQNGRQDECDTSGSEDSIESKSETESQDKPTDISKNPYKNSMTVSRQVLLDNKNYGFLQPLTTSKINIIKGRADDNRRDDTTEKETKESTSEESTEEEINDIEKHDMFKHFLPLSFNKNIGLRTRPTKNKKKANEKTRNIAVDYYYGRTKIDYDFLIKEIDRIYRSYKENQEAHNSLESIEIKPEKYKSEEKGKSKSDYNYIKKIIDIAPDKDLINILFQLEQLNINKVKRSREISDDLDTYVTVLGDMIKEKNKALANYDWLKTTVEVQSAIKKLIDMVEAVKNEDDLHPLDLELLKYFVHLYTSAKEELDSGAINKELRALLLPKSKMKKGLIKESGLIHRIWLVRMKDREQLIPEVELKDFEEFLDDLQTALFDLHTALKFIGMVTPYKNQKWFENLMQIHLESKRKHLLEIILHMFTSRLLGLVEETAKNGVEDDYLAYVKKHKKEVERTKEEFMFVLKLLEEIKNIN